MNKKIQLSENHTRTLSTSMIVAIAGAFIGSILLKKITLRFIQILVAIMLVIIAIALGA